MPAAAHTSMSESLAQALGDFFNNRHDKLLCTANAQGEPSIAVMGTPRITPSGNVEFEINDPVSVSFDNIRENKAVAFIAYNPGPRARDYFGVRIYARVSQIMSSGEKFDAIRDHILLRHGAEKAAELQATVTCEVLKVRPIVDRGQNWNEPPFESN